MALIIASEGVSPSGFVASRLCGVVAVKRLCSVITSPAPVPHTLVCSPKCSRQQPYDTVDGRNPAPPGMY